MKKIILILFFPAIALLILFNSCNKSEKITTQSTRPLSFKSDAERDANSATLVKLITEDNDWKALVKLNYEVLDVLVKSDIPVESYRINAKTKGAEQLNSKIYLTKLEEAKKLAINLRNKYFQNTAQCYSCEAMTEAKWKLFAEKINTFRNDKIAYNQFLTRLGVDSKNKGNSPTTELNAPPDCNNWRFTLCGGACVVTAPTVVVFAACMAMCVAEFC